MGRALSKPGWGDWLYCEDSGDSWQRERCLSIRSVPWQQRWPMASWAVLVGAQPGACGEGLSSRSAPAGPHLDTVFF